MDKLQKLMEKNGIKSLKDSTASREELEDALVEIAQNQADLEDALVELAGMIGGES